MIELTVVDRAHWEAHGWFALRRCLSTDQVRMLTEAVAEVEAWAGEPGLAHSEATPDGPRIARSEDFVPHHAQLAEFVRTGPATEVLAELFGEPAVLFKEKINYKHPGGGGFAPHQDATA